MAVRCRVPEDEEVSTAACSRCTVTRAGGRRGSRGAGDSDDCTGLRPPRRAPYAHLCGPRGPRPESAAALHRRGHRTIEHTAHNTHGRTARVPHPALSPPATNFAHTPLRRVMSDVRERAEFTNRSFTFGNKTLLENANHCWFIIGSWALGKQFVATSPDACSWLLGLLASWHRALGAPSLNSVAELDAPPTPLR